MYRKLYHLGGLIFPIIIILFSRKIAIYTSGTLFILVVLFDMFRLQWKELNLFIIKKLPIRFKRKEVKNISGSPFFLGGCFITLLLFKPEYAIGGIIYLSIGDMIAVAIGKNFGKIKIFNKTLEGTLAFALSTLLLMMFLKYFGILNLKTTAIIMGSVISAIVEVLPLKIDDNLTIPLTGALALKLFS